MIVSGVPVIQPPQLQRLIAVAAVHVFDYHVRLTMPREKKAKTNGNDANLGFEAMLWAAAEELRNSMDAAEHKRVVLVLIILRAANRRGDDWGSTDHWDINNQPKEAFYAVLDPDGYRASKAGR